MTPLMVMKTKGNGVDGNDGEILLDVLITVVLVRLRSAQGLFMERRPKASVWFYPCEGQLLISSRRPRKPSTTTPATPATPAGAHLLVRFLHAVEQTESTISPLALTPRTTEVILYQPSHAVPSFLPRSYSLTRQPTATSTRQSLSSDHSPVLLSVETDTSDSATEEVGFTCWRLP